MSLAGRGRPGGPRVRLVPGALEVAEAAHACRTWPELAATVRRCTACPELAAYRGQVVVGDVPAGGPARARLALVGEAPGAEEDAAGRPFVGRAGRLLDGLLAAAGLDRAEAAVLNVLRCRPPGNRPPRPEEATRCRGWLDRSLELVQPELVVTLGLTAAVLFLGRRVTLAAVRGAVHEVDGQRILPTYHPSAAIRFGPDGVPRAALAEDLRLAATLLG
ncbi:MAG TPA: uracil-DNA glycosylase [Mycobacteriales bacterium]|nr:uracil-DNA glycosylase [Mycobacteriales bacterium]